ncbi:MAG: Rieske (2Fe-2S) protein [Massilia sp.]|jgi:nitrite reductase/ring-hydroxylating ferredoxin subunit|nr:Rieske (2Fe-2S) protein [Massilia sp.]
MPESASALPVGASSDLLEGGHGIRFAVRAYGAATTGFVIRKGGVVYGYLNRCAHVPIELDWAEGEFFESSKTFIMCQTHGAIYTPETGHCAGGPCKGGRLRPIQVAEADGRIVWMPDEVVTAPAA